jgi:hypothetical protein
MHPLDEPYSEVAVVEFHVLGANTESFLDSFDWLWVENFQIVLSVVTVAFDESVQAHQTDIQPSMDTKPMDHLPQKLK